MHVAPIVLYQFPTFGTPSVILKKKRSQGIDKISASHLQNTSFLLIEHLTLLFQMIFAQGIVPSTFCVGSLTPVPKKGKPPEECTSF